MLNTVGWVSFIFTSLIALATALNEHRKHGFKPKTIKYYTNLFVLLSVCLGIALYPFDKISAEKEKTKLNQEITDINKKAEALQKQNKEITIQNEKLILQNALVKNQIQMTNNTLKIYKSQISQFSVVYSVSFEINSSVNISTGALSGFLRLPHVALSDESNYHWIYFSSSPVTYDLSSPFSDRMPTNIPLYYSYHGVASVGDGIPPIGNKFDVLKKLNIFTIYIPMHTRIAADIYNSRNFRVNGCSFFFTINGVDLSKYRINCPEGVLGRIGEFSDKKFKDDFLTVQFKLKNDLYELLALDKF